MNRVSMQMYLLATILLVLLAGCRLQITVPQGGHVEAQSGAYQCQAGQTCNIDIYDIYFDQTFVAVPAEGYQFTHWRRREKGFCGGDSAPCHLYTTGFIENHLLMEMLESDSVFFLEPVFSKLPGCHGSDNKLSGNKVTLRQGEYAVREIVVKYKTNMRPRSRLQSCPQIGCSVSVNRDKSESNNIKNNFTVLDLKFATTEETPIGSYKIEYITYKGGRSCDFIFGCVDTKLKILKRWKFQVKVVDCPL